MLMHSMIGTLVLLFLPTFGIADSTESRVDCEQEDETSNFLQVQVHTDQQGEILHEKLSLDAQTPKEKQLPAVVENLTQRADAKSSHVMLSALQSYSWYSVGHAFHLPGVIVGGAFVLLAGLLGAALATVITSMLSMKDTKEAALKPAKVEKPPAQPGQPGQPAQPAQSAQPAVPRVIFYVMGHFVSSSMLTISNKIAMKRFHPPGVPGSPHGGNATYMWTLVVIQFLSAAFVARLAGASGLTHVTSFEPRKALAFFPAAGMFMITIVAGNAVMNFSNVSAFLVIRSLVPLPCSLAECWLYEEPWPPLLSGLALLITVGGATGYGICVGGLEMNSIAWALMYLAMMPIDGLLIKHSISSLDISPWGLVYYNNILAAMPAIVMMFIFEIPDASSFTKMMEVAVSSEARVAILVSCLLGISISYFQLRTRYFISATAFMVLGVVNKFATVLVNHVINEHQGLAPFSCIVITISGAILWQMTVKGNSIKVREGSPSWEKSAVLPFALACAGLAWAGYVEYTQVSA